MTGKTLSSVLHSSVLALQCCTGRTALLCNLHAGKMLMRTCCAEHWREHTLEPRKQVKLQGKAFCDSAAAAGAPSISENQVSLASWALLHVCDGQHA